MGGDVNDIIVWSPWLSRNASPTGGGGALALFALSIYRIHAPSHPMKDINPNDPLITMNVILPETRPNKSKHAAQTNPKIEDLASTTKTI